ncbi:MAG: hypothetical protein R2821_07325 [Flavobacteriaceae bacterium]
MIKLIFLVISIFFPLLMNSQVENLKLKELETKKEALSKKLIQIQDSLNKIGDSIVDIKAKVALKALADSTLVLKVKKDAIMKDKENIYGNTIYSFRNEASVVALGYINGHFKVCYKKICGYIDKVWIKNNPFDETIQTNNTNLKSNSNSITYPKNSSQYYNNSNYKRKTSTYRTYYRGPRGGCYYINSNGNKTYVDRSLCN